MKSIIKIENVSKRYQIGTERGSYQTLREAVSATVKSRFKRALGHDRPADNVLWALKEITFDVKQGEVLGLIGHNGAGKSTLLKILSRITEPTEGRIELYGRIGSLLEVGTGFHPELTGRENVYLNGAILGMSREKIDSKFAEIVAFSEIEQFLDTPVKRYSSGMYVRLAFAVAAHMEPEVLLVDEVLSVGDLAFQNKCFNHMLGLKRSGMTILLVSHNMTSIQGVCERSIYLDHGNILAFGNTEDVIKEYRSKVRQREREQIDQYGTEGSNLSILSFEMFGEDGQSRRSFQFGESVRIRIRLNASRRIEAPLINFGIRRGDGVIICNPLSLQSIRTCLAASQWLCARGLQPATTACGEELR
jgi:lipopolysaccharide transport system ATP-binding protein